MAVNHIKEDQFEAEVLKSDVPVLVDFYADWCGPCKMMAPLLAQVSDETENVMFAAIDVDEAEGLAIKYGISSIPCMIYFKNGEEADRIVGAVPKQTIVDAISK